MEKYVIYHHSKVKPRNKTEKEIVLYIKNLLKEEVNMNIEEVKSNIQSMLNYFLNTFSEKGVKLSKTDVFCNYVGSINKVERSFSLYGRGRGTCTLTVKESIPKDASKSYIPFSS